MKKEKECKWCGKVFEYQTSKAKYCSGTCKEKARISRQDSDKNCVICNKLFYARKPTQLYCSHSCSLKGTTPSLIKELVCCDCGITFEYKGRSRQLRCADCRKKYRCKMSGIYQNRKNPDKKLGVGSGGNQDKENNHRWNPNSRYHGYLERSGYGDLKYQNICYIDWDKECVLCSKIEGLIDVHHINGVRDDSRPWNLVPVCRKCHLSILHKKKHGSPLDYSKTFFKLASSEVKKKIAEIKSRN